MFTKRFHSLDFSQHRIRATANEKSLGKVTRDSEVHRQWQQMGQKMHFEEKYAVCRSPKDFGQLIFRREESRRKTRSGTSANKGLSINPRNEVGAAGFAKHVFVRDERVNPIGPSIAGEGKNHEPFAAWRIRGTVVRFMGTVGTHRENRTHYRHLCRACTVSSIHTWT